MKKSWNDFEELVLKIQKDLVRDADVKHNEKILDQSGIVRQIDVSIRKKIGFDEALIIIECKQYKKPVSISLVESFRTKLLDLGASYGILVSSNGFTNGAVKKAKHHNIKLYTVGAALEENWKMIVGDGAWLDFIKSEIESLIVESWPTALSYVSLGSKFNDVEGNEFSLAQIIEAAKNQFGILQKPGNYSFDIILENVLFSKNEKTEVKFFKVSFIQKTFLYNINLKFQEGYLIKDELSGEVKSEEVFSEGVEWKEILKRKERREITVEEYEELIKTGRFMKFKKEPKKFIRVGFKKES